MGYSRGGSNMVQDIRSVIIDIVTRRNRDKKDTTQPTIFHHILDSDLPAHEKAIERLVHEAQSIVFAGSETTAWALSVSSFHITNDPQVLQKLRAELSKAMPYPAIPPTWSQVEQLPYLNAVIKEAVRLSYGLATRNPRLFHTPIQYKDWIIPAGTPVSMTSVDVFHDESIFPEHRSFRPERWLDNPRTADGLPLDRYFIGFGKGGRKCLGIKCVLSTPYRLARESDKRSLAYAELHMALATVFRRFSFELYETDVSDVEMARDCVLPMPKLGSNGVRVIVRSDELSA